MEDRVLRPVAAHQTSAVELVTAEIRRSILRGILAPGQTFSVAGLARQLGVSHIPVREALRRLEGQGLIELEHARSAVVVPLTVEDVRGIYNLRLMIEPELAARSTRRRSPEQLEALSVQFADLKDEDPELMWQAHQSFHLALVSPAASEWHLRTLDQLWAAAERYTRLVFDFAEIPLSEQERRERVHGGILEAVRSGDPRAARRAVAAHLTENESELVERIGRLERMTTPSSRVRPA